MTYVSNVLLISFTKARDKNNQERLRILRLGLEVTSLCPQSFVVEFVHGR